jgi:hypothetical protein
MLVVLVIYLSFLNSAVAVSGFASVLIVGAPYSPSQGVALAVAIKAVIEEWPPARPYARLNSF